MKVALNNKTFGLLVACALIAACSTTQPSLTRSSDSDDPLKTATAAQAVTANTKAGKTMSDEHTRSLKESTDNTLPAALEKDKPRSADKNLTLEPQEQAAKTSLDDESRPNDKDRPTHSLKNAKPLKKLDRFSVNASEVSTQVFFSDLMKNTGYQVNIHPDVQGHITLKLSDATLDNILSLIERLYGYDINRVGKTIDIYPRQLRSVRIPVDYQEVNLNVFNVPKIDNAAMNEMNPEQFAGLPAQERRFWLWLTATLEQMIGTEKDQQVQVLPTQGVVEVKAYGGTLNAIVDFLNFSQKLSDSQLIMETKIVEVTLDNSYQEGLNWAKFSAFYQSQSDELPSVFRQLPTSTFDDGRFVKSTMHVFLTDVSFHDVLAFIDSQGVSQVLPSPRLMAANDQKSMIKVGTNEYVITNILSTSKLRAPVKSSEQTTNESSSQQRSEKRIVSGIQLTPYFEGLRLDIMARIDNRHKVRFHVHPVMTKLLPSQESDDLNASTDLADTELLSGSKKVKEVLSGFRHQGENNRLTLESKQVVVNDHPLKQGVIKTQLPKLSLQQLDVVATSELGQSIIISGLLTESVKDKTERPFFWGSLPLIGQLFEKTRQERQVSEWVILLKPVAVLKNQSTTQLNH